MHGFKLISRHCGALDVILGHTPYMSGSFGVVGFSGSSGVVGLCRQILAEMLSHVLISWGFHHIFIRWHTCHT